MKNLLVFGSCNIDIIAKTNNKIITYDKNPGITYYGMGGVGRNIYESLCRLGLKADFATNYGNDLFSQPFIDHLESLGGHCYLNKVDLPTSSFTTILDENNDYYLSISSMEIANHFTKDFLSSIDYSKYDVVSIDANSPNIIEYVTSLNKIVFADATSAAKVIAYKDYINKIDYLKCSKEEFHALFDSDDYLEVSKRYPQLNIILTDKEKDILYYIDGKMTSYSVDYVKPVSTIGAGDSFSAGLLYGIVNDYDMSKCIELGKKVATLTLQSDVAVSDKITKQLIEEL